MKHFARPSNAVVWTIDAESLEGDLNLRANGVLVAWVDGDGRLTLAHGPWTLSGARVVWQDHEKPVLSLEEL